MVERIGKEDAEREYEAKIKPIVDVSASMFTPGLKSQLTCRQGTPRYLLLESFLP
jgi:hypothetical protein